MGMNRSRTEVLKKIGSLKKRLYELPYGSPQKHDLAIEIMNLRLDIRSLDATVIEPPKLNVGRYDG